MEEKINKEIGEYLKNIRKNTSIKKTDITKILSVSSQQLTKYENGTNRISASKLIFLLRELNIDFNIFSGNDSDVKEFLFYFSNIKDKNVKKSLIELIKNIAKENK